MELTVVLVTMWTMRTVMLNKQLNLSTVEMQLRLLLLQHLKDLVFDSHLLQQLQLPFDLTTVLVVILVEFDGYCKVLPDVVMLDLMMLD